MEKDMQIELRKEKLIASLEKGTVVMLTLNDDDFQRFLRKFPGYNLQRI